MRIKLLEKAVIDNREYEKGEAAIVGEDQGRRLIKKGVAAPIKEPSENEMVDLDSIENRSRA